MKFFIKFFCISLLLFLASCGSRPPNAIGQDTVSSQSKKDYDELKAGTENVVKEIDLYQAIAIAIKHNRNLRIQMLESALSQEQRTYENVKERGENSESNTGSGS